MGKLIILAAIGLVAGWLASQIMKEQHNLIANLGIGVAGAFIGGFLARLVGLAATGFLGAVVLATIGAIVLLWVMRRLRQ